MLSRRRFLKLGVVSGLALGGVAWWSQQGRQDYYAFPQTFAPQVLTEEGAAVIAAMAPVILDFSLAQRQVYLGEVVNTVDRLAGRWPQEMQDELRQVCRILAWRPTRHWGLGMKLPWQEASEAEIAAVLENWRLSKLKWKRALYQALRGLIVSAWYDQDAAWAMMAYPGPPLEKLGRTEAAAS